MGTGVFSFGEELGFCFEVSWKVLVGFVFCK